MAFSSRGEFLAMGAGPLRRAGGAGKVVCFEKFASYAMLGGRATAGGLTALPIGWGRVAVIRLGLRTHAAPWVKQHLAAIRILIDYSRPLLLSPMTG